MQYKAEYIWSLIGKFFPLLVYLVTTMVLSRFLTPEDFGKVGVLSVFFTVASVLMDSGLGGSLINAKEISKKDCDTIFTFNVVVSCAIYLLLFLFANVIECYFEIENLSTLLRFLSLIFLIDAWGLVSRAIMSKDLHFKEIACICIIAVIIAAVLSIIAAVLSFGVYAIVIYQITYSMIGVVLSIIWSKYKPSFSFEVFRFKRLFPFGFYTTLVSTIDTIYENLVTSLFGKYINVQQAGFLYQAKRLEEVPTQTIATTIGFVSFPVLSKIRNDKEQFILESNNIFRTILLLVYPALAVIALFSHEIIRIVYGSQWDQAALYLTLLILAAVFLLAETLNRTFIKAYGNVKELFWATCIKRILGVCCIIIALLLSPEAMLYGYIISAAVGYVVNLVVYNRILSVSILSQLKDFFICLLPSALFFVFVYWLKIQHLGNWIIYLVSSVLFILYYIVALIKLFPEISKFKNK